jgi:hypothetical protein
MNMPQVHLPTLLLALLAIFLVLGIYHMAHKHA